MPDDLGKRGLRDRKRQSKQPHEKQYRPKRESPGTVNKVRKEKMVEKAKFR